MGKAMGTTDVRQNNVIAVYDCVRRQGPLSKKEIQQATGLSWGSVSMITARLSEEGFLCEIPSPGGKVGRRPAMLSVHTNRHLLLGMDINRYGMIAVLNDLGGKVLHQWERGYTGRQRDQVLEDICSLVAQALDAVGPEGTVHAISLSLQGEVDEAGGIAVHQPFFEGWRQVPLQQLLQKRFEIKTFIFHDPNCLLMAEQARGDALPSSCQNALVIRLDNGVGMAILSRGRIYTGAHGHAAELGHTVVYPGGDGCQCGKRGCLEAYASEVGVVHRYYRALGEAVPEERAQPLFEEILAKAQGWDPLATRMFEELGSSLGVALSNAIALLDPEVVVLYGSILRAKGLFADAMEAVLRAHVRGYHPGLIADSKLDRNAPALGASALALRKRLKAILFGER